MTASESGANQYELSVGEFLVASQLERVADPVALVPRTLYRIERDLTTRVSHGRSYVAQVIREGEETPRSSPTGENERHEKRVFVKTPKIDPDMPYLETRRRLSEIRNTFVAEYENRDRLNRLQWGVAQIKGFGSYVVGHPGDNTQSDSIDSSLTVPYLVQEFVEGATLEDHATAKSSPGHFKGLRAEDWFRYAMAIVRIVKRVHNQQIVHGDIAPRNIVMVPRQAGREPDEGEFIDGTQPTLVDFGQSFLLDQTLLRTTATPTSAYPYRAPETREDRSWWRPADIFSVGAVLHFLATGAPPPAPSQDLRTLKKDVAESIRNHNAGLYQANPAIAKIIDKCLRYNPSDRYEWCENILEALNNFNVSRIPRHVDAELFRVLTNELCSLWEKIDQLHGGGHRDAENPKANFFSQMLYRRMENLKRDAEAMRRYHHEIYGDREDIIDSLVLYLGVLDQGDQYLTVTLPGFWTEENLGVDGRFLAMNRVMALRGVIVRRVFLVTQEDLEKKEVMAILTAHHEATEELRMQGVNTIESDVGEFAQRGGGQAKPEIDRSFYTGFRHVTSDDIKTYKSAGHHVALWRRRNGESMSIIFGSGPAKENALSCPDPGDLGSRIIKVRFWYTKKQSHVHEEIMKSIRLSRPICELFRSTNAPKDV